MPRYALKISYDGTEFVGFQWQRDQISVQEVIESALRKLEPEFDRLVASGRTDAGVHALGQVVHADLEKEWDCFRLMEALNYYMKPHKVACLDLARVDDKFSARFSCVQRRYLYRFVSRRPPLTIMKGLAWHIRHPLDVDAMNEAAQILVGHHDFTSFRSSICQSRSPVKTVDMISVVNGEGLEGPEVHIEVHARSFLHNQVRSFAGTLERVGAGRWTKEDVKYALEARDRSACGPVAPPFGLYFLEAVYRDDIFGEGL